MGAPHQGASKSLSERRLLPTMTRVRLVKEEGYAGSAFNESRSGALFTWIDRVNTSRVEVVPS